MSVDDVVALRAPRPTPVQWMRRNLFTSAAGTIVTVSCCALVVMLLLPAVRWLVVDARWSGTTGAACHGISGACWPFVREHAGQLFYGFYPTTQRWRVNTGLAIGALLIVLLSRPRFRANLPLASAAIVLCTVCAGLLFSGGYFGLSAVPTSLWGGFFLTLVVSYCVLTASLPIGILLGLGRRSHMPLIRTLCSAWVELWRAVPAVVLLFVAIIMFPLFMPHGLEIDKLLRALIALTLLMSAYLAEVVRGALQGVPAGQIDAARALGLSRLQTTGLVVLPQALSAALPQITSQFIGLFKETTVLLIIGFYDLLGVVQTVVTDPQWLSASTTTTGFVFAAFFFWSCCFAMSRFSVRLERRRDGAHR